MNIYKLHLPFTYFVSDNPEDCLLKIANYMLKNKSSDRDRKIKLYNNHLEVKVVFTEILEHTLDLNEIGSILQSTPFPEDRDYINSIAIKLFCKKISRG